MLSQTDTLQICACVLPSFFFILSYSPHINFEISSGNQNRTIFLFSRRLWSWL